MVDFHRASHICVHVYLKNIHDMVADVTQVLQSLLQNVNGSGTIFCLDSDINTLLGWVWDIVCTEDHLRTTIIIMKLPNSYSLDIAMYDLLTIAS